ncbi:MAG: cobalamin B12-binding domain-containing protein [Candidatus Thermoplasmatota archaeon]
MKILGAALGNCIHVEGLLNFLNLAKQCGLEIIFLGPAVPLEKVVENVLAHKPDIVAISYRLAPETAKALFTELKRRLDEECAGIKTRLVFGGTPPVGEIARAIGIFDAVFTGEENIQQVIAYLKGEKIEQKEETYSQDLVTRIKQKAPFPLIRHHFGLPKLEETINGAKLIAESSVLDILSLAPDQNAQSYFFQPKEMDTKLDGAGGVPIRKKEDLRAIYDATRCGNFPLVRCYSGTQDLVKWAEMLKEEIDNCWGAVPLCWYSQLDGRSPRELLDAIKENQIAIRWHAEHNIPVEVTDSHQWALRGSGDTIEVATAFLAAWNAKRLGVKDYVQQYMFNTPPGMSPRMDIAKMLAKYELVKSIQDNDFRVYTMVRTGLSFLSPDQHTAKGQLAFSLITALTLQPNIVHVVGYSEGDHAATPPEIIESCKLANGVIRSAILLGLPNMIDEVVLIRKAELIKDANVLLNAIRNISSNKEDPLGDPETLVMSIKEGLLDAPQLKGNRYAKGAIVTNIVDGACRVVDPQTLRPMTEAERLRRFGLEMADVKLDRMGW